MLPPCYLVATMDQALYNTPAVSSQRIEYLQSSLAKGVKASLRFH